MVRQWSGEVGVGKGRCVGLLWVTLGSLTLGHLRVTIGHLMVTIGHLRVKFTLGSL